MSDSEQKSSKYKYFAGNLALFTISNFVSKILVFLLVPFYTNILTTADYGIADVMQTTLLLLVPALTINMGEAALRFGIDRSDKRNDILRIGIKYVIRACAFVAAACVVSCMFVKPDIRWYLFLFIFLFMTNSLYEFLILFFQGCEKVKIVVCGSVSSTLILLVSNIVFLLVIKIGLNGYLLSQMLAFFTASVLMLALGRKFMPDVVNLSPGNIGSEGDAGCRYADKTNVKEIKEEKKEEIAEEINEDIKEKIRKEIREDIREDIRGEIKGDIKEGIKEETGADNKKEFEKELTSYGIPMIAYSTGSWINNAADRYLVSLIKGVAVNGIYGVAYKIPAILTVFQRIFAQAWQMSATKSYEDDNSKEFFSTMYAVYNTFMVIGCSFLILIVRLLAFLMFKKDFYEAWQYVPPLLISVVFGAMTGFLGSICLAYKDSKAMGFATGIGAAVNILLNIILIPKYSAMGAAVATGISYFLMYFIAYIKVSKYVKLKIRLVRDYAAYLLLVIEAFIMVRGNVTGLSVKQEYTLSAIAFLVIIVMYISDIKKIIMKLLSAFPLRGRCQRS